MKYLCLLGANLLVCFALLINSASASAKELPSGMESGCAVGDCAGKTQSKTATASPEVQELIYSLSLETDEAKPGPASGGKKPTQSPERKSTSPKARQIQYGKDTDTFRGQVEGPEWQRATADRRNFGVFARNYTNRIHCDGVIQDVLYPTTKGLELEIKNQGHDLFLRVGQDVPAEFTHFPVDLNVICSGEVFQINAVIDAKYPATNLELELSGRPVENIKGYSGSIQQASALPHEEKISRIVPRVWNDKPLQYWNVSTRTRSCGKNCTLRQTVHTEIDGIVAYDFTAPLHLGFPELLATLGTLTKGDVISIGKVPLRNLQRVIILTVQKTERR